VLILRRHPFLRNVAAAVLALLVVACSPPAFKAVDITGAEYARDFALESAGGGPRKLADYRGKVVVIFFGFTQCPDVCPTTLSDLA
jgi:protein SCO1/2